MHIDQGIVVRLQRSQAPQQQSNEQAAGIRQARRLELSHKQELHYHRLVAASPCSGICQLICLFPQHQSHARRNDQHLELIDILALANAWIFGLKSHI